MSYIATLPKELRLLLDHYVNHDHWKCLSDIFAKISSLDYASSLPDEKDFYCKKIRHLFSLLPNDIKSDLKIMDNFIYMQGFTIKIMLELSLDTVVNKDLLLKVSQSICESIYHQYQTIPGIVNSIFAKYNFSERYVIIQYSDRIPEGKMISI